MQETICTEPKWFKNNSGQGIVIESTKRNIQFNCICEQDGRLELICRGCDVRWDGHSTANDHEKRMPVLVRILSVYVNGQDRLERPVNVWHDDFWKINLNVTANENVSISVNWEPAKNILE